jgi:hypothetical protein
LNYWPTQDGIRYAILTFADRRVISYLALWAPLGHKRRRLPGVEGMEEATW